MATPTEVHLNGNCVAIHIGHASTSNPSSGSAADEVLIGNFNKGLEYNIVLRPKTRELAEKSARACEAGCNNNKIEYSQTYRNTLYTEAQKVNYDLAMVSNTCYADCSSFMTICAVAGGANIKNPGSAPNCGSMRDRFKASGDYYVLEDTDHLNSSDYLKRGDILVREWFKNGSRHTVMVLDNGRKVPANTDIDNLFSDLVVIKISVDITNIDNTKIDAITKITKIENGAEVPISDAATLELYKWTYSLSPINKAGGSSESKKLSIKSSTTKFSLNNLIPGNSYILKISATELNSDAEFSSSNIIFTTTPKITADNAVIKFGTDELLKKVNKIYIKIKDAFMQAVLYNNTRKEQ